MSALLLRGANTVLPDGESAANLLIENGRIAAIGTQSSVAVIDLANTTLLPGFIDVHIHGAAGIDVMEAGPEALDEVASFLVTQGVTGWLPTLVPGSDENYAEVNTAVSHSMKEQARGARVLGLHYEGPFVNPGQCGALHTEYFKTYSSPEALDSLPVPENSVRMITMAPEVEGGVELILELKRRGWVISIGHTRADLKVLDNACDAGARHMTHFMNAMAPLHHRSPGPIAWGLSRDDVTVDLIADGIHLDPFMLQLVMKIKGADRISLISDAIAAAGKGDGDYQIWGETITVKNGRTANAAGSIAGSVISMLDAVRLLRSLGVSDTELARMASSNPAKLLGIDRECGSIEVGKRADLVALDAEGNVKLTIVGGQIVYSS
ncbi:MAG TPA: N-acetylglucosamine-6-phosphate deacetylase [Pyrinomonadaceae bacterium]|jgi:N-acetylglucosamine-6-phosphate deacetylase|nr:N-acetylglucosamine-6-phosphate deacetylase [Pyrinomonadaceae bacterium]